MGRSVQGSGSSRRGDEHGRTRSAHASEEADAESIVSLDSTLPPTPFKDLLAADGASVYVLSHDAALAETVQEAGGEQYPIHVVDDWTELKSLVDKGRSRIVLLDVDALPGRIESCLDTLVGLGSGLVVLVAAQRDAAQPLISLLSARRVHRLLIKPATVGVTRLLLESAVNRYLELRDTLEDHFDLQAQSLTRRMQARRQGPRFAPLATGVVVLLGVGAAVATALGPGGFGAWRTLGGWLDSGAEGRPAEVAEARTRDTSTSAEAQADDRSPSAEAAPDARTSDARPTRGVEIAEASNEAAATEPFAAELERAAGALEAGRLAGAGDDNALALYRSILAEAPAQAQAAAGLRATLERLYARAESELVAGNLDVVETTLASIARVEPDAARLTILESQLGAARDRVVEAARASEAQAEAEPPRAADETPAPGPEAAGDEALQSARAGDGGSRQVGVRAGDGAVDGGVESAEPAAGDGADAAVSAESSENAGVAGAPPASSAAEAGSPSSASADGSSPSAAATADRAGGETEAASRPDPAAAEYASLLTIARVRIEQGRLVEPAGDSARDYLERAARQRPDDPRLVALRTRLAEAVAAEARVVLDAGNLDEAERLVDLAFELGLDPEVQTQLDLELAATQQQARSAQRAARLERARERIASGALLGEADSAWAVLTRLENDAPGYEGLEVAWADLADALAARARTAIEAGDWPRAEAALAALERREGRAEVVAALRERLAQGRRQARYLSEPASAEEMTRLEAGSVAYPERALADDVEGWAAVEFVVDESGRPRDARVVAAEPPGYFEEAAVESVLGSRYEPFEVDGHVYERLVRVRVRFGLR